MKHDRIRRAAGAGLAAVAFCAPALAGEPAATDPLDRKVQQLREQSRAVSQAAGQAAGEAREGGPPRTADPQREAARDAVLRAGVPQRLNEGLPPSTYRGGAQAEGQAGGDSAAKREAPEVQALREASREVSRAALEAAREARNDSRVLGGPAARGDGTAAERR